MQYLADINTPNLSEEKQKQESIKNGKSPGNYLLTKEFYIAFFGELGRLMLRTFNHSLSKWELSSSQKQPVITLI